jgi:hypothetical protein
VYIKCEQTDLSHPSTRTWLLSFPTWPMSGDHQSPASLTRRLLTSTRRAATGSLRRSSSVCSRASAILFAERRMNGACAPA